MTSVDAAPPAPPKGAVPVTILTGFLGSGKTTLLNHILDNKKGLKIAVIENEYGAVGIDNTLITERNKIDGGDEIVEIMNGCICCTVRADLRDVLKRILVKQKEKYNLDGIIIETTGMADPAPVAQTFFVDPQLQKRCYLDAIITMVDAKHIMQQLTRDRAAGIKNEPAEQLAFADKILLNKIDLVPDAEEREKIKRELRGHNPLAQIIETQQSKIEPGLVLGLNAFSLEKVLEQEPDFLEDNGTYIYSNPNHDPSISSLCVSTEKPMSIVMIKQWFEDVMAGLGSKLFRYKGIVNVMGSDIRFVFQGVHMVFTGQFTTPFREDEKKESKFVFIGRDLPKDELTQGFLACVVPNDGKLRFDVGTMVMANIGPGEMEMEVDDGFSCDACEKKIEGQWRFASKSQEDFDLCSGCYSSGKFNEEFGPFEKVEIDEEVRFGEDAEDGAAHTHQHGGGEDQDGDQYMAGGSGEGGEGMGMSEDEEPPPDQWIKAEIVMMWDEGNAYRLRVLETAEGHEEGEEFWAALDSDEFIRPLSDFDE